MSELEDSRQVPKKKGFALTSMILGIVSCALGICFWYVTIPAAILGIIFAAICKKANKESGIKTPTATAGLILSIISLGLAVLGILGFATLIGIGSIMPTG